MAKKFFKLTEDEFYEQFTPTINHLNKNAAFGGTMYETLEVIKYCNSDEATKRKVWTIEEVEDKFYFVSGFHYVNRFGYFITEEDVPEDTEIEVYLDAEADLNTAKLTEEIVVIDPDTKGEVHLSVFKHEQSGGMFALDSSFIEQVFGDDDTDKVIIDDPLNKGQEVELRGV